MMQVWASVSGARQSSAGTQRDESSSERCEWARVVTAAAACDVPEASAAAAAGGRGRAGGPWRAAAGAGAGAGRGRRGLRAQRRARAAAPGRRARLPLARPEGRDWTPPDAPLQGPALLQPLPLEPPVRARYVSANDPRNKCKHEPRLCYDLSVKPLVNPRDVPFTSVSDAFVVYKWRFEDVLAGDSIAIGIST